MWKHAYDEYKLSDYLYYYDDDFWSLSAFLIIFLHHCTNVLCLLENCFPAATPLSISSTHPSPSWVALDNRILPFQSNHSSQTTSLRVKSFSSILD